MDIGKIKFYFKECFTFSRGERIGSVVLLLLIVVVVVASSMISQIIPASPRINTRKFEKEISQFETISDSSKKSPANFFAKKDTSGSKRKTGYFKNQKLTPIELNTADSAALDQLPGIGPVFSNRIIKYRKILGGYYSTNQLAEIYGIKPETFEKIKGRLFVDTSLIRKIDLNTADFKEINAHPYISYEQTKSIMKYRNRNKIVFFKQMEEAHIFTVGELMKLRPYLLLQQ